MRIKTKLIIFMGLLIVSVSVICCSIFYLHEKNKQSKHLIKFGSSIVSLLSQDNDVKLAITVNQPAFLESPVRSAYSYDIDKEVAYLKIMNKSNVIKEEKSSLYNIQLQDIPARIVEEGDTDEIKIRLIKTPAGENFYDISLPVKEKQMLTEEEFAAQVFGEAYSKKIIGFVQIGLSIHVLRKELNRSLRSIIFPVGLFILFGGFCIVIFLNKYFMKPIRNIADVSLEIAEGNLSKRLKVYSHDEIGVLTENFNQMTLALEQSYSDLKQEVSEHKHTSEMLQYRLNVEEIISAVSANFIYYSHGNIDPAINFTLKIIGEFLCVDRCYIFQFYNNMAIVENTYEWCAEGIPSQIGNLRNLPTVSFKWWMYRLNRHEIIHIPRVADLPYEAAAEKEALQAQNIQSFVVVPMIYRSALMGFLGFASVVRDKEWNTSDLGLLKIVGEILVNALEHKRKEDTLYKSEMRLKSIMDNTQAIVYIKDVMGKYILINKRHEELFHINNEDIAGKTDYDVFPKKFADVFRKNDLEIIKTGKQSEFEEIVPHDDGPHTYISVKFPLSDTFGNIYAVCSISTDITRRKDMEENLRISENKYRTLLENLPQRIFHKDLNSVYVSCNEHFARDMGISPDEIAGKTDYDLFSEDVAVKKMADDKRVITFGISEEFEEKYIKDGKEYFLHSIKSPTRDEKGRVTGVLGIFWDITEKVYLQMETAHSRHMASIGELAAGIAHEINNPINGIINYAQILANISDEQSKEKDIANRIKKESIRIANIVKSLLSFARRDEYHNIKKPARLEEILSDTFALTEAQMHKDGIKIKRNLSKTLPEIIVNSQQIQQVFLNVLGNARYALNEKFKEGHENKTIEIFGEKITTNNAPCVRITFTDHGIGIPSNILDKVMDPFFTLKPKGIGTGLGLSICHGIINEHSGNLTIESVEGVFTKVIIVLPAA